MAADLPCAYEIARCGHWSGAADTVTLSYEDRFLRRKRLTGETGMVFRVDLPETASLDAGDAFRLKDGRLIAVAAAEEALLQITGPGLTRLAWHIGNRHTPCQIEENRLLIQRDHVLADMLARLGAMVTAVTAPFTPEGGAYGHGRTMGHAHGPAEHEQSHDHDHAHGSHHHHG
ncbi:urease accessory protein UreE [Actibacterium sp. D379-3]